MLRTLAERFSRGIVFKRRLPQQFNSARMFVSPDAALAYWKPGLADRDPKLIDLVLEQVKPGTVVWDIGANLGMLTISAAHRTGPKGFVLALEPDVWLVQLLRRSLQLPENRDLPVKVVAAAAAEAPGIATFAIAKRGRASNGLESTGHRSQAGGTRERQTVPVLSLDLLLNHAPPPQFLKIDVEGAEILTLRGAGKVLAEFKPVIHCETDETTSAGVTEILKSAGYRLYDGNLPANQRVEISACCWNTLALPTAT